ncbi:MAG: host-nuclease inhibitor Gam family protein [Geminicoccaceae bacterium]|nr:host-nuclease inhibitor Gam family protein [Geminicoccaceae bacterium]
MPSVRTKAPTVWVPQTKDQTSAAIAELGELQRERQRIAADMGDEMAVVKERHERQAEPINARIAELTRGVQMWCEANREVLTRGKSKTASFATGEVSWRMTPPKVVVRGKDAVMDLCRKLGKFQFLRQKEELNKEAILAEPEAIAGIKGLSISQTEEVIIKPFETELEEVAAR